MKKSKILILALLFSGLSHSETIYLVTPTVQVSPETNERTTDFYNDIHKRLGWYMRYPLLAQVRGMEGDVMVSATLDSSGKLVSSYIKESSGNKVIDQGGIDTVENASPFKAPPPELLTDNKVELIIPIVFKLTKN
jgi:protein TonB